MAKFQHEFKIGARGWQFDQWHGSFYPDDLPDEWRFSFYSNEFRSVLIPANYFTHYSIDDWVDWADDTSEEFAFYIELNSDFIWENVYEHVAVLTKQLQGFVLVFNEHVDFDQTTRLVNEAIAHAPVCVIKDKSCSVDDKVLMAYRQQRKLNLVWNSEQQDPDWAYHGAAVTFRNDSDDNAPLVLREILEKSLHQAGGHQQLPVFFNGVAPKIEDMRSAQTIADLLA